MNGAISGLFSNYRRFFSGPGLACLVLLLAVSCNGRGKYFAVSGYAQGGVYTVKYNSSGIKVSRAEISAAVDSILTLVDTTLSGYNHSSVLSRFNDGETVLPNGLFCDIYAYARRIFDETETCVDVAAGPLFDIWGFGFSTDSLPSADIVARTLASCGMDRLSDNVTRDVPLDGISLLAVADSVGAKLNFNAIAQGYTCDLVADYLKSVGVKDMLVDIGEIYCSGLNPYGQPWSIAVDRPVDGNDVPGADIDGIWQSEGRSCGIVTSGNYRKFYVRDGRKYAHTIDPRTGIPVDHNLLSATLVAPTAADADAFATYCMVIGLEQAKDFILGRPELEGYLIYDGEDGMTEWASPGFSLR